MANESFVGRMAALPGKRLDDFLEQTERYQRDEINLGSQMLQGGANALGMLTDIPLQAAGEAVSAVIPEVVKKGLQDVSENIMETEAAKVAIQWAEENPQKIKNLGYVADLSVIPALRTAKKGLLQDVSVEASNRQPSFYGSGKIGQVGSVFSTAPSSVLRALSPKAAASRREGLPEAVRKEAFNITPDRINKANEIKNKKQKTKEEKEFLASFNKDLSFLEGQLDQTQLISRGRGLDTKGVVSSFEKVQQLGQGVLNKDTLSKASSFSNDVIRNKITPSNENLAVIEEKIRKSWGIDPTESVEVVIRNPKGFSDLVKEIKTAKGTGSKAA